MAERSYRGWPPSGSPPLVNGRDDRWTHFDSSVNAISFGFVATAVLISMFLVLAILERFLRPATSQLPPAAAAASPLNNSGHPYNRRDHTDQLQMNFIKPSVPSSHKVSSTNAREVSVLMPGESVPRFIAHPVPPPCPPERFIRWPSAHTSPKIARSSDDPNMVLGSIEYDIL